MWVILIHHLIHLHQIHVLLWKIIHISLHLHVIPILTHSHLMVHHLLLLELWRIIHLVIEHWLLLTLFLLHLLLLLIHVHGLLLLRYLELACLVLLWSHVQHRLLLSWWCFLIGFHSAQTYVINDLLLFTRIGAC